MINSVHVHTCSPYIIYALYYCVAEKQQAHKLYVQESAGPSALLRGLRVCCGTLREVLLLTVWVSRGSRDPLRQTRVSRDYT